MANIGTTTAFYKVKTSLTRANTEVSKSMERLATGKQNANAGDRSSYVAMSDTFRMDFVGTKAGIKGGAVVMGYLETGMRVLDAASSLLSRLQELQFLEQMIRILLLTIMRLIVRQRHWFLTDMSTGQR